MTDQNQQLQLNQLSPEQFKILQNGGQKTSSSISKNGNASDIMFPSLEKRSLISQNQSPLSKAGSLSNPYNSRMKEILMRTNNVAQIKYHQNQLNSLSNKFRDTSRQKQNIQKIQLETDRTIVENLLKSHQQQSRFINELDYQSESKELTDNQSLIDQSLLKEMSDTFMRRKGSKVIKESVISRQNKFNQLHLSPQSIQSTQRKANNKVTGVNFYLQDLHNLNKISLMKKKTKKSKTQERNLTSLDQHNQSTNRQIMSSQFGNNSFISNSGSTRHHSINQNSLDPYTKALQSQAILLDSGREKALQSIENNIKQMSDNLNKNHNYKKFFWTPDLNLCGFATQNEIKQTLASWHLNKSHIV